MLKEGEGKTLIIKKGREEITRINVGSQDTRERQKGEEIKRLMKK